MRRQRVEPVEATGPHVQVDRDSGLRQSLRVGDRLIAEGLGGADVDIAVRQPAQVLRPGRRGVDRDVLRAAAVPEQGRPPEEVVVSVPEPFVVQHL